MTIGMDSYARITNTLAGMTKGNSSKLWIGSSGSGSWTGCDRHDTPASDFVPGDGDVTVCYDSNGGRFGESYAKNLVAYRIGDSGVTEVAGTYEDPEPPASDKAFGGWFKDAECTEGQEFQPSGLQGGTQRVTVYSSFTQSTPPYCSAKGRG